MNDDVVASEGGRGKGIGGVGGGEPIVTPQPRYGSSDEEEDDVELPPGSLPEVLHLHVFLIIICRVFHKVLISYTFLHFSHTHSFMMMVLVKKY